MNGIHEVEGSIPFGSTIWLFSKVPYSKKPWYYLKFWFFVFLVVQQYAMEFRGIQRYNQRHI